MKIKIDKTAIIKEPVYIGKNVSIGAYSIIGPNVKIGNNNYIDSHVIIKGKTIIGNNNKFFSFSQIGVEPQCKNDIYLNNKLIIGNNNIFRECTSIHKGTTRNNGTTFIGNNNYLMVNSHIAHDCLIKNNIVFSNGASAAGHVTIDSFVTISGFVGINQYTHIGKYSFATGGTIIRKDVLPYVIVSGYPAKTKSINVIGLKRRNFNIETITNLKKIYRLIFNTTHTIPNILIKLNGLKDNIKEKNIIINFLKSSKHGITR